MTSQHRSNDNKNTPLNNETIDFITSPMASTENTNNQNTPGKYAQGQNSTRPEDSKWDKPDTPNAQGNHSPGPRYSK